MFRGTFAAPNTVLVHADGAGLTDAHIADAAAIVLQTDGAAAQQTIVRATAAKKTVVAGVRPEDTARLTGALVHVDGVARTVRVLMKLAP